MSYTVHRLILSYGLFIVSGCDLVCGVLCTWRGLCLIMWSDRTNCYIRLSGTHWENPSEWKRGCGAIWWFDMWLSLIHICSAWPLAASLITSKADFSAGVVVCTFIQCSYKVFIASFMCYTSQVVTWYPAFLILSVNLCISIWSWCWQSSIK